jgi:hypothetical protein
VVGTERAFGQLKVDASSVSFEPRGALNSVFAVGTVGRIVHTERTLVLVRARLRPPSISAALQLIGNPHLGHCAEASVRFPGRNHAALVDALAHAEFRLDQQVTWFTLSRPS